MALGIFANLKLKWSCHGPLDTASSLYVRAKLFGLLKRKLASNLSFDDVLVLHTWGLFGLYSVKGVKSTPHPSHPDPSPDIPGNAAFAPPCKIARKYLVL